MKRKRVPDDQAPMNKRAKSDHITEWFVRAIEQLVCADTRDAPYRGMTGGVGWGDWAQLYFDNTFIRMKRILRKQTRMNNLIPIDLLSAAGRGSAELAEVAPITYGSLLRYFGNVALRKNASFDEFCVILDSASRAGVNSNEILSFLRRFESDKAGKRVVKAVKKVLRYRLRVVDNTKNHPVYLNSMGTITDLYDFICNKRRAGKVWPLLMAMGIADREIICDTLLDFVRRGGKNPSPPSATARLLWPNLMRLNFRELEGVLVAVGVGEVRRFDQFTNKDDMY
jgi:hypothetical protein